MSSDLDDYTINHLLAEIAGPQMVWDSIEPWKPLHPHTLERNEDDDVVQVHCGDDWYVGNWDPLTDIAQLWPLIVREKIDVRWISDSDDVFCRTTTGRWTRDPNPLRAMALAILEKHREQ